MPPLTTPKRERVEGVYGFLKSLHAYAEQYQPDRVLVLWDSGRPLTRMAISPAYKANRRKGFSRREEREFKHLNRQLFVIKDLLPLLGVKQVSCPNTEADDLIAVASRVLKGKKLIVSGDRDLFQLINKDVCVLNPNHKFLYNYENFKPKIGLTPEEWYTVRVLSGDASDNIPPIRRGIGEVTATKIVHGMPITLTPEMQQQFEINKRLMQLKHVENEAKLAIAVRFNASRPLPLKRASVKYFFLNRAFSSLLADFPTWISAFQGLK